jgi:hypothetical protein
MPVRCVEHRDVGSRPPWAMKNRGASAGTYEAGDDVGEPLYPPA